MKRSLKMVVMATMALPFLLPSALAQSPPAPTTTFTNFSNTAWTDANNWNSGVPGSSSDALIGTNRTIFYDQAGGDPAFGTLTLGTNATFQFDANSNQGIPTGRDVYFSDGSHLEYVAGSSNRDPDFFIIPGADATWTTAGSTFFRGTLQGAGNLTVIMKGNVESRVNANSTTPFTGNLTYESNNGSARQVTRFGRYGGSTQMGSGTNTLKSDVYLTYERDHNIPDAATLRLEGDAGPNYKLTMSTRDETVANLIIDSPTATADYFERGSSGTMTVTDTVTFLGTAGTVLLDDTIGGSGNGLVALNMTFAGTGTWALDGDCIIRLTGGTISNAAAAAISNTLNLASSGFTKTGTATLTLGGTREITGEHTMDVAQGTLEFNDSSRLPQFGTISVTNGATLDLNYAGTGDILYLNLGGTNMIAGVYGHTTSGANNGGQGVGKFDGYFANRAGMITNGGGGVANLFYWDGGDVDIGGGGDLVSDGGAGTWNTTTSNWDIGYVAHATWGNTTNDEAIIDGTAGTINLDGAINIGDLTFTINDGQYTIAGGTMNFGPGSTISVNDNRYWQTITSVITGSPTVETRDQGAGNQYKGITFAPGSGSQTLGVIKNPNNTGNTDKAGVTLGGSTTGNVVERIYYVGGDRYADVNKSGSSTWTVGDILTGELNINGGNLIMTGRIYTTYSDLHLASGTLHYNNPGAVDTSYGGSEYFQFEGGSLDNSSGSNITVSTYNPRQLWSADWTFIGSGGASGELNLGTGAVTMNASRTVTVSASTLTVGGVISGSGYSLTKAGAGTLELTGANTYSGNTHVNGGTLSLSNSAAIGDATQLYITNSASVHLSAGVNETVFNLFLSGTQLVNGTWGSTASAADYTNNTYFSGSGIVTVSDSPDVIANTVVSGQTTTSATFNATLNTLGTEWHVYVYWGETDGTNNVSEWTNNAYVGSWTNIGTTNLSVSTNGLAVDTAYYYTFRATNTVIDLWADPSTPFATIGPPTVTVNGGASAEGERTATLNGLLTGGGLAAAYFCWGVNDGGTASTANWENVVSVGSVNQAIAFSNVLSGLFYGHIYDYRVYVTNEQGTAWSGVDTFSTSAPIDLGVPVTDGIQFWIAADDIDGDGDTEDNPANGAAVSTWSDKTGLGGGRDVTREGSTDPVYNTSGPNGKPVLTFSGDYMSTTYNFDPHTRYTIFSVARYTGGANNRVISSATRNWLFGFHGSRNERFHPASWVHTTGDTATNWILHAAHMNDNADPLATFFRDGTALTTDDNGSPGSGYTPGRLGLGGYRNNSEESNAEIAEILIYDDVLSAGDLDQIGGYLEWKYDLATAYSAYTPPAPGITNTTASDLFGATASVSGVLDGTGSVFTVYAYWSTNNNANSAAWLADGDAFSSLVGSYTNTNGLAVTGTATNLAADTLYYYTLLASNELTNIWASPNVSFTTPGVPFVDNSTGPSAVSVSSATLRGNLTNGTSANAWFVWGPRDGGIVSTGDWSNAVSVGVVAEGVPFSALVTGLDTNTTYWYRSYVSNGFGYDFSDVPLSFDGVPTGSGGGGYSMQITFTNFAGKGTLTNFPALVRFTTNNTDNYTGFLSSEGWDLRFWTNSMLSGTELDYEIERFDSSTNSYVWVQIPELTNNLSIWASWGDAANTNQETYTTNGNTWGSDHYLVHHLSTTNAAPDSSTIQQDGTPNGMEAADWSEGVIADGLTFDGSTAEYTIQNPVSSFPTTEISASMWLKSTGNGDGIISYATGTGGNDNQFLLFSQQSLAVYRASQNTGTGVSFNDGSWHHMSVTWRDSDNQLLVYKNGVQAYSGSLSGGSIPGGGAFVLAQEQDSVGAGFSGSQAYPGSLDEVRISNVIRSSNWVWACWMNQGGNHNAFVEYGTPSPSGGVIQNIAPTNITNSAAYLNATLTAENTNYTVNVYWGDSDGGTNAGAWSWSEVVGAWTNVASTNVTYQVNNLNGDRQFWYTFRASNNTETNWASPSWLFTTFPGNTTKQGTIFRFR